MEHPLLILLVNSLYMRLPDARSEVSELFFMSIQYPGDVLDGDGDDTQ